jgi:hypothetical protein
VLWLVVALPVLYVASSGPAAKIVDQNYGLSVHRLVYTPVYLVAAKSSAIREPLGSYWCWFLSDSEWSQIKIVVELNPPDQHTLKPLPRRGRLLHLASPAVENVGSWPRPA